MNGADVMRYAALGQAAGARSSAAAAVVTLTPSPADPAWLRSPAARWIALAMAAGETVGDKLPQTPSRLQPQGLVPRVLGAGGAGAVLARRDRVPAWVGAAVAAATSVAGAYVGARWRSWANDRFGRDIYGALVEDAVTAALATWSAR